MTPFTSSPDPSSLSSCSPSPSLPSNTTMSCLQPPPSSHRSITSRPKLTLQTTSLPLTFGSSTTGLSRSFNASSTASPTVRNTFKNAYDVTSPSTTTSPSKGPSSLRLNTTNTSKPISPYVHHSNQNTSSFSYRSPYTLPLGVRSILRNSPLEGASRRRSGSISAGASGPGGAGARRVFFPAKKQVSFKHILEEEIHTEQYTAQHLDLVREEAVHEADSGAAGISNTNTQTHSHAHTAISLSTDDEIGTESGSGSGSGSDSDSSNLSVSESSTDEGSADETGARTTLSKEERKKRRTLRIERQVRAVALLDGLEKDPYASTPQTPRQSRVKRRREWKWTLGPIEGSPDSAQSDLPQSIPFDQPACNLADPQPESKSQ